MTRIESSSHATNHNNRSFVAAAQADGPIGNARRNAHSTTRASNAPSRRYTRRDFLLFAGLGLSSLVLPACGAKEPTSGTTANKVATTEAASTPAATPAASTVTSTVAATTESATSSPAIVVSSSQIVTSDRKLVTPLPNVQLDNSPTPSTGPATTNSSNAPLGAEFEILGRFSEGLALVQWKTAGYDEEWKTEHDPAMHLGAIDTTGRLVLEYTEGISSLPGAPKEFTNSYGANDIDPHYSGGLVCITCHWNDGNDDGTDGATTFVYDKQGKLQFSLGDGGSVGGQDAVYDSVFRYGVLSISRNRHLTVLDGTGNALVDIDGEYEVRGDRLYCNEEMDLLGFAADRKGTRVQAFDFSGTQLFGSDSSLSSEHDETSGRSLLDGLAALACTKKNPYGEDSKDEVYHGIYDMRNARWVFGPFAPVGLWSVCAGDGREGAV